MLTLVLALLLTDPPATLGTPIGKCDPVGGPSLTFTQADRDTVRAMVRFGCEQAGDAEHLCLLYDAILMRESRGKSSVRHTRGEGEDGIGWGGLSKKWHRDKWPGPVEPAFCDPMATLAVVRAIAWRAVRRYGAENALDVQAIYSGRFFCRVLDGRKKCFADPSGHTASIICGATRKRGFSCHSKRIDVDDFGPRIRKHDRPAWAAEMNARWGASR